ncbi:MAG TPA: hypothetical protein VK436_06550 [Methanocella sp.]|nr:hypothetical protein [Methanocella sp.]
MTNDEMIISTIKKVYAIRASIERRAEERIATSLPLTGYILMALDGTNLSRDQEKDVCAYITATCTTHDRLSMMETISAFKSKNRVTRPWRIWFAFIGLIVPLVLVIAAEVAMEIGGLLTQIIYIAVAIMLLITAMISSLIIFSLLGYDPEYRREAIEYTIWKYMNTECRKRLKQGVREHTQLPPPPTPATTTAANPANGR